MLDRRLFLLPLALLLGGWAHIRAGDGPNDPPLHFSRDYVVPIHTHSAGYRGLPFEEVRGALEAALATWSRGDISISFGRDPAGRDGDTPAMDGVNVVRFEHNRLPPDVDPRTVLAFTSHTGVYCTGTIVESDITFNAVSVDWSTSDRGRLADIETVMLHEAGHLIGLDHTNNRDAVMFPSIVERLRRELHADDIAGIRALYDPTLLRACAYDGECQAGEACIFGAQSDESFGSFCGPRLGNAGVGQRCNANAEDFCSTGCASGTCLGDGTCSGVCRDDRDCPGDLTCLPQDTGGGQIVNFCINLRECRDAGACPAGQACVVTLNPADDSVLRICVDGGDTRTGQPCRSSDECAGAWCYGGVCTELCDGPADCAEPFSCTPASIPLGGGVVADIGLCRIDEIPCGRQSDCPGGLDCAYVELDAAVRSLCVPGGPGEAGAACGRGAECRSSVCLDGVCSDVCRNDADCPLDMECQRVRFLGASVNACVRVGGEEPPADAGGVAEPDAGAPQPGRDGSEGPPPLRDAGPVGLVDARAPGRVDGGGGPIIVITPDSSGGGGQSGCRLAPVAPAAAPWWALALLSLRRRRRRAG